MHTIWFWTCLRSITYGCTTATTADEGLSLSSRQETNIEIMKLLKNAKRQWDKIVSFFDRIIAFDLMQKTPLTEIPFGAEV
ncbi:hypothetical protein PBAL39_00622 [Pedobacter sp. BAL39]|uniref:hypothetical protein n=1 Tax=Pedobacter sp. BAL39 TaxID=391596 RepID=UPI0001559B88|nr:hypothetical protein [Pedobacter sp. BAL39]EDM38073.1 hypothetical protein PBAL39_00622 [Pedobacter sp. BAL39]